MTVTKVTISLESDVAEQARRAVADGTAKSLSAWINDAARARLGEDSLGEVLGEILAETGGPLTDAERAHARALLGYPPRT